MSAKPKWSVHDNLDDRKEFHILLQRIPPKLRVRWLKWCCSICTLPGSSVSPSVSPWTTGENSYEIYFDFWSLTNEYQLDATRCLLALQQIVRGFQKGHFHKNSRVRLHV